LVDLAQVLISESSQSHPHIWAFLFDDFSQKSLNVQQEGVFHIVMPSGAEDAIGMLENKIV